MVKKDIEECYVCGKSDCKYYEMNLAQMRIEEIEREKEEARLKLLRKRAREPFDEKKHREAMRSILDILQDGVDWGDKMASIEEDREELTDKWDELCDIEKDSCPVCGRENCDIHELIETIKNLIKTINKPKED